MNSPSTGSPRPDDVPSYRGPLGVESTHWSVIREIQSGTAEARHAALLALLDRYVPVFQRYLRGSPWKLDDHAADDIVQGFIQVKILEGQLVQQADERCGRFRSLLRVSLDNFVRDRIVHRTQSPRAQARGTDSDFAPMEFPTAASALDPFETQWARQILHEAIERLRTECRRQGKTAVWTVFEGRLLRPIFSRSGPCSYELLAVVCGLDQWKEAANLLVTAKRMFRRIFEGLIQEYSDADLSDEIVRLKQVFSTGISLKERFVDENGSESFSNAPLDLPGLSESWAVVQALELQHDDRTEGDSGRTHLLTQLLDQPLTTFLDDGPENPPASLIALFGLAEPPVDLLAAVKDWAKRQAATNELNLPPKVLSLIYFSCIAIARCRGAASLSGISNDALELGMTSLQTATWCDPRLAAILQSLA